MSLVATRFAPSPTGPLHIGGVRTALFNWLFSKNNKGKFYLRIEDTDKERSKDEYKNQIIQSLKWIGINYDGKEYIQSKNIDKHKEIAEELLKKDYAYKCYCSEKEIEEQRVKAKKSPNVISPFTIFEPPTPIIVTAAHPNSRAADPFISPVAVNDLFTFWKSFSTPPSKTFTS